MSIVDVGTMLHAGTRASPLRTVGAQAVATKPKTWHAIAIAIEENDIVISHKN